MAVLPGTIPRGPNRFIDGVPTAYRFFQSEEAEGGISGQTANLVTDAEFHLQDYRDQQPMLWLGPGEYPNPPLADMQEGLFMFELANRRPTWLKVFYYDGTKMAPVEPAPKPPNQALQRTATGGWFSRVFRALFRR